MALSDILRENGLDGGDALAVNDVTRERVDADLLRLRKLISYWRAYPDKFVDFLCSLNPDNTFKFFFYQRV